MNEMKDIYYIIIGAVFTLGLIVGLILCALLSEDCKQREELCKVDIEQNLILQETLKKQEALCLTKIDSAVKQTVSDQTLKFNLKFSRLQDACNQLDCAQCQR